MTIQTNTWCTVHYATQDFTPICEIGRYIKDWEQKVFILDFLVFTFTWARVYRISCRVRTLVQKLLKQNHQFIVSISGTTCDNIEAAFDEPYESRYTGVLC